MALCDLVVGTEEEVHIAGGSTDTLRALRAIRDVTDATVVMKRGPLGCVVYEGGIPDEVEDGLAPGLNLTLREATNHAPRTEAPGPEDD